MAKGKGRATRSPQGQPGAAVGHQAQTSQGGKTRGASANESLTQDGSVVVREISEQFSGPLPHPSLMAEYNRVVTDGAERVFQMAEGQIVHRQEMERIYVSGQATTEKRGQLMAFVIAALALALGAGLVFTDHSAEGFALIVTAIASLAGVNVFSRILEHREAGQRRREDRELEQ